MEEFNRNLATANADPLNTDAHYRLAICYLEGKGVEQDRIQAITWLRRAAMLGSGKAQFQLGRCLYSGVAGFRDVAQARTMWEQSICPMTREAEKRGDAISMHELGEAYRLGRGVERDTKQSIAWYHRAADKGNIKAQSYLARCYHFGGDCGVGIDWVQAMDLYQKVIDNGGQGEASTARTHLSELQQDICSNRNHLLKAVRQTLDFARDQQENNSLAVWVYRFAMLSQKQTPVGSSPLFVALVALAPEIFGNSGAQSNNNKGIKRCKAT